MTLANLPAIKVEFAPFDAPLETSPTWYDISAYALATPGITINRGRSTEAEQFSPGHATLLLDNRTRIFDPLHGPARVTLTGAISTYVSTPDAAASSLTADLEAVWIGSLADWTPANTTTLCGKWNPGGDQRSWQLRLTTGGILRLVTSATGTSTLVTTDCTAAVPFSSGRYAIKVTLDADNGAGSNVVKFWYGDATANEEPASWTQLGSTVTTAGVRAIFDSTATLDIGTMDTTATTYPFIGSCNRFILRNAIGGTVVADFNGRDWVYAATTCTSSATAEVWTLQGAAAATAAPYYGYLKPRCQLRISSVWSASTVVQFQGHVVGWPQRFAAGNMNLTVPLDVYDGLAWLNEATLTGDGVYSYAADTVEYLTVFYRQADAASWTDTEGGTPAFPLNEVSFGSSMCEGSESPSVEFVASTAWVAPGTNSGVSLAFWITTEVVGTSDSVWAQVFGTSNTSLSGARIGIDNFGYIVGETDDYFPGTFQRVRSTVPVNDGNPHHVVFVNNSGTPAVYVDGVDRSSVELGGGSAGDQWWIQVIGAPCGDYESTSTEFIGSLQDIALFSQPASPISVAGMFQAAQGYITETTSERADRVFLSVGWPGTFQDLTAAPYGVCHAPWTDGTSALSHLQLVANTEQGRLFASKTNEVTLHPRYWHQTETRGTTSQLTLSDDGAGCAYQMVGTRFDDIDVANSITVSAVGVGSVTAADQTSITDYGWQSQSIQTLLPSLALCRDMANGLLYWRKDPTTRTTPIVIMPGGQTSQWPAVLGLELGDRITVEVTPYRVGAQTVLEVLIESIAWDITGDNWVLTLTASPVPASFAVYGTDVYGTGRYGF